MANRERKKGKIRYSTYEGGVGFFHKEKVSKAIFKLPVPTVTPRASIASTGMGGMYCRSSYCGCRRFEGARLRYSPRLLSLLTDVFLHDERNEQLLDN